MTYWDQVRKQSALPFHPPWGEDGVPSDGREPCDSLGLFAIPQSQLEHISDGSADATFLDWLFPEGPTGTRLSRGMPYYRPEMLLGRMSDLVRICGSSQKFSVEAPQAVLALFESLLNALAAAAFELWERECDLPGFDPSTLDDMMSAARDAVSVLVGIGDDTRSSSWSWRGPSAEWVEGQRWESRSFREIDSLWKVRDEILYLMRRIEKADREFDTLLVPLYGSFTLGLLVESVLSDSELLVEFIRLGFHDLGMHKFFDESGEARLDRLSPQRFLDPLGESLSGDVLVLDDNVGYGTTLRACRNLVSQFGGTSVTRSVETAWDIYGRRAWHSVSDAVDWPSLRPNFHHSIQGRLVGLLRNGDSEGYLREQQSLETRPLTVQLAMNLETARGVSGWSGEQLLAMTEELSIARLDWTEPGVPLRGHRQ